MSPVLTMESPPQQPHVIKRKTDRPSVRLNHTHCAVIRKWTEASRSAIYDEALDIIFRGYATMDPKFKKILEECEISEAETKLSEVVTNRS